MNDEQTTTEGKDAPQKASEQSTTSQIDDSNQNAGHGDQQTTASTQLKIPPPQLTRNTSEAKVTQASLSKDTEGLVMYDLACTKGASEIFSPNTMRTILDLKLLGVGYDRQSLTFHEIRTTLANRVAENVTVPTLELANGSHIIDSWAIAEYLYNKHDQGHLLFPTTSSKVLSKLMESFVTLILRPNVGPLIQRQITSKLDPESQNYYDNVKIGKARIEKLKAMSQTEIEKSIESSIQALAWVESLLQVAGQQRQQQQQQHKTRTMPRSTGEPVWLESGDSPTHADFILYGWYVFTRATGPDMTRSIWHAHPAIAKYVQDMDKWSGPDITTRYF